tara:strand:+ start:186 stop:425 length:240 start_codon:yes stop_codon:yes gene_type:complete
LQKNSILIFLDTSFEILKKRQLNISKRGIVGLQATTFSDLFKERHPLYLKHADITIKCDEKNWTTITKEIMETLNRTSF